MTAVMHEHVLPVSRGLSLCGVETELNRRSEPAP